MSLTKNELWENVINGLQFSMAERAVCVEVHDEKTVRGKQAKKLGVAYTEFKADPDNLPDIKTKSVDLLVLDSLNETIVTEVYRDVIGSASGNFTVLIFNTGPPQRIGKDVIAAIKGTDWHFEEIDVPMGAILASRIKDASLIFKAQ